MTVDNQYDQYAVFSSETGNVVRTLDYASTYTTSLPNFTCTYGSTSQCEGDYIVDFTEPAFGLSLYAVGAGDTGQVAQVRVFQNGIETAVVPVTGAGSDYTPILINLSAYPEITRIEVINVTDAYGLGWDDFSFTVYE